MHHRFAILGVVVKVIYIMLISYIQASKELRSSKVGQSS